MQSRLYWIIKPGSDVYFVFNQGWKENVLDLFEALQSDLRTKISYTFRF